jgi:cation diffusion facilitator family transporter
VETLPTNHEYKRGVRRVLLITLALNVSVVIGKFIAGFLSGSLSVISDAVHSSVDSLNNIVGLVIMKYATAEPDDEHPYGHAKFETLAAFAIAGFLFVTCYEIGGSAIARLFNPAPDPPAISALTIGVMVATIIVNVFVTVYEQREGKRLNSEFLMADAVHTRSDVLVSCSVLAGLGLVKLGYVWLDPMIALGIAVVIAWNGYKIFKSTIPVLVDAAPVPADRIAELVATVPGVHSAHDIRSRVQGGTMYIEMHLHMQPSVERDHVKTHDLTEEIERKLEAQFGRVIATIHVEPFSMLEKQIAKAT